MKIGIIADIHDHIPNLLKTIEILNKERVKKVYFCGDLTSPFTLKFFQGLKAPIKAVFGNNEGDKLRFPERIKKYKLNMAYGERSGLLLEDKLKDLKIVVFHGHVSQITESLIKNKNYDLVLTGHTHDSFIKKVENKIWINPGTINGFAEHLFNKPSFALFDLVKKAGKVIHL